MVDYFNKRIQEVNSRIERAFNSNIKFKEILRKRNVFDVVDLLELDLFAKENMVEEFNL